MMETPSCDLAIQAIHTLYGQTTPAEKDRANKWLERLQKSVYAWQISDDLLQRRVDHETCYFAAQTMRTKIQMYFHELPPEAHVSLRDSLLNLLSMHWSSIIVTQLALATVDLALVMTEWKTPIDDLINRFGSCETVETRNTLLEVLTVFPEETDSKRLRLGQNRRRNILDMISLISSAVMQVLKDSLERFPANQDIKCQTFRCMSSWLYVEAFPSNDPLLLGILVPKAFEVLAKVDEPSSVHEAAREAITEAITLAEDTQKYHTIALLVAEGVYSLHDTYLRAVNSEDSEKPTVYCRIFTALGDSLSHCLVSSPGQGLGDTRTLELILLCAQHYDYEMADLTFSFWTKLATDIYNSENRHLCEFYRPFFSRLLNTICDHCRFDIDREGLLDADDEFLDFRERCTALIQDVVFIVGGHHSFENFRLKLTEQQDIPWNVTEAVMFILCAIAQNVNPEETPGVAMVVEAILRMPDNCHITIRQTSLRLLGELAEWISKHPIYSKGSFDMILKSLRTPLAPVAASSLQKLSNQCREHVREHTETFLEFIIYSENNPMMSNEAVGGLLQSVVLILAETKDSRLTSVLESQLKPLDVMLRNANHQILARNHASDPALWADRVTLIFRRLTCQDKRTQKNSGFMTGTSIVFCEESILLEMAQRSWLTLDAVLQRYNDATSVMERVSRTLRYIVRALGKTASPLLAPLANRMINIYQMHQHSCFLYLTSILVDEFGDSPNCTDGLIGLVSVFTETTFKLLNSSEALEQNPDTVDDLFRLCSRCIQRLPMDFMKAQCFRDVLQCSLLCSSMTHREANTTVMKFLREFLLCSETNRADGAIERECIRALMNEMGHSIIQCLLHAAVLKLPPFLCYDVAEVIFEIQRHIPRQTYESYLTDATQTLPKTNLGGHLTLTPEQLHAFLKEAFHARKTQDFGRAIRDLNRLYT